jgi:hypothetical protein
LAGEDALAAALAGADAGPFGLPLVPGAVIAIWPVVPVLVVTGVRPPCVRNGIIA